MQHPKNLVVDCGLIDPPNNACKLKPKKIEKLIASFRANGLLQPPGVVEAQGRFRIIYGHHRFRAWQKMGHSEIEVRVLPPELVKSRELSISLQENHVREPEDFEDTLARVELRAKELGCTFKDAAQAENVNPAYISRAQKIVRNLAPAVLKKARSKGVGFSVLYELAAAKTEAEQGKFLDAYLAGTMKRDAIASAIKKRKPKAKPKQMRMTKSSSKSEITLVVDKDATYERIQQIVTGFAKDFKTHQKNGIPVGVLPELFKKGGGHVVSAS